MYLDIMMPKIDGYHVLQQIRKESNIPVIILSAKDADSEKILGLNLGADDYLAKPFAMKELLARVRAMTRRKTKLESNVLEFEGLTLNRESFELVYRENKIRLGSKEYQMMELLMQNPNAYLSAEQFMQKIWGFDTDAEIGVVWVYLSYLRKKLQGIQAPIEIKAARGIGYKLVHHIEEQELEKKW